MKLAITSIIAFLAAYAAGGSLFAPSPNKSSPTENASAQNGNAGHLTALQPEGISGRGRDLAAERIFLEQIAATAPEDLEALYLSVMRDPQRVNPLAKHWAETDPAGMHAALERLATDTPDRHRTALWFLFSIWPASDSDAAITAALAWKPGSRSSFDPITAVVSGLMQSNPNAAVEFITANPNRSGYPIVPAWAIDDPARAAEIFGPLLHTKQFNYVLRSMATTLAAKDPAAAAAWASSLDWRARPRAQFTVARAVLAKGNLDAGRALLAQPDFRRTELGGEFGADFAAKIAEQDPAAALAWATENLSGHPRSQAMYRIIDSLAASDLKAAMKAHGDLPPGRMKDSAGIRLAMSWAKTDRTAALEWTGTLEGAERANARRNIANDWFRADAPSALAFAAEHPDYQTLLYGQHATKLASDQNPEAALDWIASLPESETGTSLASTTLGNWAFANPDKATEYVTTLPEGPARDSGIATVAGRYFRTSEARALDWARTLPPADRANVIAGVREQIRKDEDKQRIIAAIEAIGG